MLRRASKLLICLSLFLLTHNEFQVKSSDVIYIYDELGRLVAVIDPSSDAAIYKYDAAGNLLSITRQSSALVSVIEFTPNGGAVGASVTIYGTGFSPTPNQNTVTFNGTAATVASATANRLVTSVPAGATTGPIAVTTPSGSATSGSSFVVAGTGNGAPSITGFSPSVGVPGAVVSISGANFDSIPTNNTTRFNITPAGVSSSSSGSITAMAPQGTSGRISVATPSGTATSSGDFFIPPSPYTAADVLHTSRMSFGETRSVTIGTANKIGLVVFDGTAGARVSLNITDRTFSHSQFTIYSPDSSIIKTQSLFHWQGNIFIEPVVLPLTGTYTIFVGSLSNSTGSTNLTLYSVPPDLTGTISIGGSPVSVSLSPGQNGSLTFNGTAGQKISLTMSSSTINSCAVEVKKPDGVILTSGTSGTGGGFIDGKVLPVTGNYTVFVDPAIAYSGGLTITLHDASDVTGTINVNGPSVTVTTTVPGQNGVLTFSGAAGQRLSLNITGKTFSQCVVYVNKPDGNSIYSQLMPSSWTSAFMDTTVLPVTGTYTIFLDPSFSYTGSVTFTLLEVPADVTGTIAIDGPPVTISVTTMGQNAALTSDWTAGLRVGLSITGVTIPSSSITVKKPDGTTLTSSSVGVGGLFLEIESLPVTGTYTITVNPTGNYTGNMTLALTDISDVTGTITAGGAAMTLTTTKPGQNVRVTFTGATDQRISLRLNINLNCYLRIFKPDGSTLISQMTIWGADGGGFVDTTVLPVAGTYSIQVDPWGSGIGSATLTLYDVPADVTGTITAGGGAQAVTITTPGQNAVFTFEGAANQKVSLRMTGVTITSSLVSIKKPDGTVLVQASMGTGGAFIDVQTLPVAGTYTILVNPNGFNTGNVTLTLYDASEITGTLSIGDPALTVTINNPGQNARLTFSGTSGQQVTVRVTNNVIGAVTVKLLKPDGTQLTTTTSGVSSFNLATQTLPTTGTYTVLIDPASFNTGSLDVRVTNP
jgi:YD repeat-containing protein